MILLNYRERLSRPQLEAIDKYVAMGAAIDLHNLVQYDNNISPSYQRTYDELMLLGPHIPQFANVRVYIILPIYARHAVFAIASFVVIFHRMPILLWLETQQKDRYHSFYVAKTCDLERTF